MLDLGSLNPPQREAVTYNGGPLLVLAGAGSGKTRVITYRIAHLIERGVEPKRIAALTFTNKAATEMRERVAKLIRNKKAAKELTVSTFHSLGLSILKSERSSLGFPRGFVIYDAADQLGVIRELLRTINIHDRRFDVKAIQSRISLAKNAFVAPEDYQPNEEDEYDEITAEVYPRYQAALRAFAAVDFDDLITESVRLFGEVPSVRERWGSKYRHVLVDEYQDTNRAQLLMVKTFVADHGNLCVVGDDDQSIYSWRGADTRNILQFEKAFPGAHSVVLDQNYRSTPTILEAANAVISNNVDRRGKSLWSDKPSGEKVIAVVAPENETEAQFVAREISSLCADGYRHSDIAVLYRSNIQTKILEEALRLHEVPYRMFGGQQFFERKEVKDLIAYLRVALSDRDEISLRRIINYPSRGIGQTTLARLAEASLARRTSLWSCVSQAAQIDLGSRAITALEAFTRLIEILRNTIETQGPLEATRWLIKQVELFDDLRAASPSLTAAQRRIDNVESLLRSLTRHQENAAGTAALADYLRQLSLESQNEDGNDSGERVTLTTLHGAKGLEFPIVFVIGVEEELLPHARTLMPTATDSVNAAVNPDHACDVSEERRLAYVGITRAMERLYMTRAECRIARGRRRPRTPSRFLLEIPEHLVVQRDIAAEGAVAVETEDLSSFFAQMGASLDPSNSRAEWIFREPHAFNARSWSVLQGGFVSRFVLSAVFQRLSLYRRVRRRPPVRLPIKGKTSTKAGNAKEAADTSKAPDGEDVLAYIVELNSDKWGAPPVKFRKGHVTVKAPPKVKKTKNGFEVQFASRAPIATPAVYKGKVFVSGGFRSKEYHALVASTGASAWSVGLDDDGPSSTACEEDVCVFNTESCTVFALDANTGKQKWSWWLGDPLTSAPTIAKGRVFTSYPAHATANGKPRPPKASHVLALSISRPERSCGRNGWTPTS